MDAGSGENKKFPASLDLRLRDEHLEALKLLAGQIAHDFNNLLAPMLGYVSMIGEEAVPGSNTQAYVKALDGVVRKVGKNIETLLLATRPQRRFHPELFNFDALIRECVEEWKSLPPGKDHIELATEIQPCQLFGDRAQWRQVCLHLLNNGTFALEKGGKLSLHLATASLSLEECDQLGITKGDGIKLTVKDSGVGMSQQVLARACHPFFTTRPKNLAQGLGLTIVHSVVHLHGGQVVIESSPGNGTLVNVWVPIRMTETVFLS